MTKNKSIMAKIDLMFAFILMWSIISTTLLVKQHYKTDGGVGLSKLSPKSMIRGLDHDERRREVRKDKRRREKEQYKRGKADKASDRDDNSSVSKLSQSTSQVKLLPEEQYNLADTDEFPFTRSLETFDSSDNFYIYTVNTVSSEDASLEWSEVPWKELVHKWNPTTTFDELINLGSRVQQSEEEQSTSSPGIPKKLVIHCLPKTASTTLRDACKHLLDDKCPEVPRRHDPYGYRSPTEFYHAVNICTEVHQFCVQGGDLLMNVIGYSGTENDDDEERKLEASEAKEAMHFVHLVPFRNFNEWAASALKQIYEVDGKCDRIDEMLQECLGYRELYMELYTKSVLAGLIGMSLDVNVNISNDDNPWRKHKHHLVLYNYEDTSTIVTDTSNFFGIEPMPRTSKDLKGKRSGGTCPKETLNVFHDCHDESLNNMEAIRDFKEELKRRKQDDRLMKKILADNRKREGWVPRQRRSKAAKKKMQDDEYGDAE